MEGYCLNCSVAARHEPGIIVVDDDTARKHGELQYTAANIERILPDAHTYICDLTSCWYSIGWR